MVDHPCTDSSSQEYPSDCQVTQGLRNMAEAKAAKELDPRLSARAGQIELLLLGCTHYPLIRSVFESCLGSVKIIDAAFSCALEVKKELLAKELAAFFQTKPFSQFFVSGKVELFQGIGEKVLGKTIEKVLRKGNNFTCLQKAKGEVVHGL